MLYRPIMNMGRHPYLLDVERERKRAERREREQRRRTQQSINSRTGRRSERRSLSSIGAKSTPGSGAVLGDGDGHIMINGTLHYIEHKNRTKGTPGPTSGEWSKAVTQGADIFIVVSPAGTLVTVPIELFRELLCSN